MMLSDIAIRRPVFAWMLMIGLMFFGVICMTRMGVSQLPDFVSPVLTINVNWPGAAPELIDTEIVDRVEQAVISVQGLKNMESTMRQGVANIKLEFQVDRNIDAALQETNARLRSVTLPSDADPPTIYKMNRDENPIMWLAVTSTRPFPDLIAYIDANLRDVFQVIPGVGNVILGGWSDRNLRVWVDNEKLRKYELTILDVKRTLQMENQEVAGGQIENSQGEFNLRTMGEAVTPAMLAGQPITFRGGERIYQSKIKISDVARVVDGIDDQRRISRTNGLTSIGLGVQKQRGYNEVEIAHAVRAKIDELNKTLPADMKLSVNYDGTQFTEEAVKETEFTVVLSALVTGLVCWAFLGSWRSTFNVLISIPTSVLGTFIVMYLLNFTLNFFTLLGLSLAIGIVVDDAILVLENIVRHFHMGKTSRQAASEGAREITFAAVAATASVISIFSCVLFVTGIAGVFLFAFGATICTAVALSLLEAITLTPMRCAQFMTAKEDESRFARWVNRTLEQCGAGYAWLLGAMLSNRWKVLGICLGLFTSSCFLVPKIRKEFAPSQDAGIILLRMQTPVGSSLGYTSDRAAEVEKVLATTPGVRQYMMNAGGFGGGEINTGMTFVSLVPRKERAKGATQIMEDFRAKFADIKDLKVMVIDPTTSIAGNKRGVGIELSVRGPSYPVLRDCVAEITKRMESSGVITDLDTDFREGAPEIRVIPDRERAAASNVSVQEISNTVNAAIGGVRQGKFTNDGRRYDVRLRLEPEQWSNENDVGKLMVRTSYGELVPLLSVARTEKVKTLLSITRENRERAITIYGNVKPGASQEEALRKSEEIARDVLPPGYHLALTGSSQAAAESFSALPLVLALGIITSYMVLAAQFNSFVHPFTILLCLPFTGTGAFLALYLSNNSFNLYSAIGLVLLMGIVLKNGILLVEFFNKCRHEEGLSVREAIIRGGPVRLRPIAMTSAAMICAAIPPALGFGPGAEVRVPLAIVIIGGTVVSTFFSLLVVPCMYSLLAAIESKRNVYYYGLHEEEEGRTRVVEEDGLVGGTAAKSTSASTDPLQM